MRRSAYPETIRMVTLLPKLATLMMLLLTACAAAGKEPLTLWQVVATQGGSNQWTSVTIVRDGAIQAIENRALSPNAEPIRLRASDIVAFHDASRALRKWGIDHPTEKIPNGFLMTLPQSQLVRSDGSRMDTLPKDRRPPPEVRASENTPGPPASAEPPQAYLHTKNGNPQPSRETRPSKTNNYAPYTILAFGIMSAIAAFALRWCFLVKG
jgi:hypothetical protein